ncbi:MAG: hypothetical protein AB7O24_01655 [Kofleriaceae bacterium]
MNLWLLCILAAISTAEVASAEPMPPDDRCQASPGVKAAGLRHRRNRFVVGLGPPNHRGNDLIAAAGDAVQRLGGKLAYGPTDKDLQDEDVEVFACVNRRWQSVGRTRTDSDGRFQIALTGAARLPAGMRDLYVASLADATGAWFVGFVVPAGSPVIVTDIDGTLTWSENSIIRTVLAGRDIAHRPNAPAALTASGYPIVYVTTRGDLFTAVTRDWLTRHGFPRGALRLAGGLMARAGQSSVSYKTSVLRALTVPIAAGIGNRRTDITAYRNAGLTPDRILIHLPEFVKELRADLAAGKATGFSDYRALPIPRP